MDQDHNLNTSYQQGTAEKFVALGTAVYIVAFCTAMIFRDKPIESLNTAVYMRILLSLACGILAGLIPGFLHVSFSKGGLAIRSAGALAFAVLTFVYTPKVLPNIQATQNYLDRYQQGDVRQALTAINGFWDLPQNRKRYQDTPLAQRAKL